jgi:hypothetical protein
VYDKQRLLLQQYKITDHHTSLQGTTLSDSIIGGTIIGKMGQSERLLTFCFSRIMKIAKEFDQRPLSGMQMTPGQHPLKFSYKWPWGVIRKLEATGDKGRFVGGSVCSMPYGPFRWRIDVCRYDADAAEYHFDCGLHGRAG